MYAIIIIIYSNIGTYVCSQNEVQKKNVLFFQEKITFRVKYIEKNLKI